MVEVGDDISSVDFCRVSKYSKVVVGVIVGVSVGCDLRINVDAHVDNDVVGEVGSGDDGRSKLKIWR